MIYLDISHDRYLGCTFTLHDLMRTERICFCCRSIACSQVRRQSFYSRKRMYTDLYVGTSCHRSPTPQGCKRWSPYPFMAFRVNKPELYKSFKINSLFVSASPRNTVNEGLGDYVPVFLSDIPELFYQGILPIDVAIVQVSIPDKHGYCSLGVSVDVARAAVNTARYVIAQVNPNIPRTHGDGAISDRTISCYGISRSPTLRSAFWR